MKEYISIWKYLFYVRELSFAHLFVHVENQKLKLFGEKKGMEQFGLEEPKMVPSLF